MSVYAPVSYIFPSALKKYEELFDTQVGDGKKFKQKDREKSLQALMTVNLLKRLESSVHAFRLTLTVLKIILRKSYHKLLILKHDNLWMKSVFQLILGMMKMKMMRD
ncbi:hypothetical protein MKR66_02590 [Acinetobacter baumannii]